MPDRQRRIDAAATIAASTESNLPDASIVHWLARHTGRRRRMPRGDKSSYTAKQRRQAEHIEEGYERCGVSEHEAERRAWATVNKETSGGKKSGSGRGKRPNRAPSRKGGKLGGAASANRSAAARSASAKKAAATRKRRSAHG
jgi:hypothetical protein